MVWSPLFRFFSHLAHYRVVSRFPVLYSRSLLVIYVLILLNFILKIFYWSIDRVVLVVKNPPGSAGDERHSLSPWVGKIPWSRKWQPTILAWRIPWTEDPVGLRSMGSHRVAHN